jgi:glycosyltransferase involved in cell wall biosynthesis
MAPCDVVAVPSVWHEAFGRVVIEAMGQGTPVCASRIGGMPELMIEGVNGFFARGSDVDDWRDVLLDLITRRNQLPEVGVLAHQHARDYFSIQRTVAGYVDLYKRFF